MQTYTVYTVCINRETATISFHEGIGLMNQTIPVKTQGMYPSYNEAVTTMVEHFYPDNIGEDVLKYVSEAPCAVLCSTEDTWVGVFLIDIAGFYDVQRYLAEQKVS